MEPEEDRWERILCITECLLESARKDLSDPGLGGESIRIT